MNIDEIIKYSFKKIYRDKKNIYFGIVLIVLSMILIGTLTFGKIYNDKMNNFTKKNIHFRSLVVSPSEDELLEHYEDLDYNYGFKKILNIEHITEMYNISYNYADILSPTYKTDEYNGVLSVYYGTKNTIPKVILGDDFKESETGVAICAKNFSPSLKSSTENLKEFINSEQLLNSTFELVSDMYEYKNGVLVRSDKIYKKTFKIVGFFDNLETMLSSNSCYISSRDMKEFYHSVSGLSELPPYESQLVIVDNNKNVNQVMDEISDLGFDVKIQAYMDDEILNNIKCVSYIIIVTIMLAIILLTIFYVKKKNINSLKEFGLLKSMGYKNKEICIINLIQIVLISVLSFLITILLFEFLIICIKIILKNYLVHKYLIITHSIFAYIFSLIVLLIIPAFICLLFDYKNLKFSVAKLLKENI